MKRITFQRVLSIFGLSALTVLFLACPDALQVQEQRKTKVTFTVADNTARTVLPQAALTGVASYKLLGGRSGAEETTLIESFTVTETSVALEPGTWNFTLNAYNDSGVNILQGKVQNKQINLTGDNQVSFSLSGINSGTGSIQITLNFPEAAGITRISASGDAGSENFTPDTGGNFVYAKNEIAAGDYFINFELYRGDVLRTVISELVLVRNGLTSSKTITLAGEDLKPIYLTGTVTITPAVSVTIGAKLTAAYSGTETITYQWNKGGIAILDATAAQYTPNSTGSYTVTVSAAGNNASLTSAAVAVVGPAATVPGTTLQAKLTWLANTAESNSDYVLEVSNDETIPSFTLSYSGKSNIVITLKSTSSMRTINFTGNNEMFTVGAGIILVLDNNITLQRSTSGGTLVSVSGTLVMNTGSAITRGGVSVSDNGTFTMNGGTISGNTGSSSGGVYVNGGTFTMSGGEISGNTASSGGGVYVNSGTFTMSGGEISGNTASSGGGVYVNGTFTMSGGEISGNTGGGVSVYNGTFTMNDGEISGNIGGGVSGALTMNGGTISGNTATNGGGVSGPLTMNGGTISGNTATTNGGGVYVGTSFTMGSEATIFGNTATNGGGVYVDGGSVISGGTFTMNSGKIFDNTAIQSGGGVYVGTFTSPLVPSYSWYSGTFIMNGGEIFDNTASQSGGGVYVTNKGTFTIDSGTISGNTATNGGGVYGALTMSGGTISGNTATNGGGVYVTGGTISSGTISGNTATNGGGVYVSDGTISGGTISGNTASQSGGGVCVDSSGTFTKTSGTIYGYTSGDSNSNTVKNDSGTVLGNKGHAVWVNYSLITIHKETTAGSNVNLSWNGAVSPPTFSGSWEY